MNFWYGNEKHGVWVHERKVGGREGQSGDYYGQSALSRIDNFFHERARRDTELKCVLTDKVSRYHVFPFLNTTAVFPLGVLSRDLLANIHLPPATTQK